MTNMTSQEDNECNMYNIQHTTSQLHQQGQYLLGLVPSQIRQFHNWKKWFIIIGNEFNL